MDNNDITFTDAKIFAWVNLSQNVTEINTTSIFVELEDKEEYQNI